MPYSEKLDDRNKASGQWRLACTQANSSKAYRRCNSLDIKTLHSLLKPYAAHEL